MEMDCIIRTIMVRIGKKNDNPDLTTIYINDIAMDSLGNVYLGTIGKGVYKSSDGGISWIQMFGNGIENITVTKIAVNSNNEIFAGTPNNGMFIKTYSSNWRYLSSLPVGINNIYDLEIIAKDNNDIIIISTNLGIYLSYSNAENWIKTNSNLQAPAINLFYNKCDSTLYAGLKYVSGIFYSKDFGNYWEMIIDKSGLYSKIITKITLSDLGFLYAGTEKGLIYRTDFSYIDLKPEPAKVTINGETEFCDGGFTILQADPKYFNIEWSDGKRSLYDTLWIAGNYWYSAIDTLGLTVISDTITIKVYPKPEKPKVLFNGEFLLCTVDAFSYRWYYNNILIPNSNFKTLRPDNEGWYKCEIFTEYDCKNVSDEVYVELTLINDILTQEISFYPNPVEDFIFLNGQFTSFDMIEIYNSLGKLLLQATTTNIINVSNLESGVYFFKLNNSLISKIFPFVKD